MHFLGLLSDYEKSSTSSDQASQAIYQFLSSPRHSIIDFNAQSDSGTTLLHEAVKRKDTSMIEFVMKKGGDVFVRDRKGRGLWLMMKKKLYVGFDVGLVGFRSSFCRNGERVVASPGNPKGVRSDRLVLEMEKG